MTSAKASIITRFPPSPTGLLHVGSARTALFNYLFTKHHGGKMYFRVEDTDKERSKREFEEDIVDGLTWLGIQFDPIEAELPFWRQSERGAVYKKYLEQLIANGSAYISKEEVKEEGQRSEVVRFKNPNVKITFTDLIRGDIEFDTSDLKDFVIAKSVDEPLYHLAVVVDDHEAGVTHVIRGEDGISNTPRQILIQRALGFPQPTYGHIPLILDTERAKLSKRKHGETVSIRYYRDRGYSPEALVNFLALLGWNPGTDQEIFSMDELIRLFDISRVQKGGASFNVEKLNWMNREYLLKLPLQSKREIVDRELKKSPLKEHVTEDLLDRLVPLIMERISTPHEIGAMVEKGELDFIRDAAPYEPKSLLWKGESDGAQTAEHIEKVRSLWHKLEDEHWTAEGLKSAIWTYVEEKGKGNVLWPIRFALSGKEKSPDPFVLAHIVGKTETERRLSRAVKALS